jgi:hypothetical protein
MRFYPIAMLRSSLMGVPNLPNSCFSLVFHRCICTTDFVDAGDTVL